MGKKSRRNRNKVGKHPTNPSLPNRKERRHGGQDMMRNKKDHPRTLAAMRMISEMAQTSSIDEKIARNDFHCWVVDKDDKLIFDPYFKSYDFVRKVHGCSNKKMFYEEWDKTSQQKMWSLQEKKMTKLGLIAIARFGNDAQDGYCSYNCQGFMSLNQGKDYRICIGKMGWMKEDKSVWWEFG